jgi:hypothetical protein
MQSPPLFSSPSSVEQFAALPSDATAVQSDCVALGSELQHVASSPHPEVASPTQASVTPAPEPLE